MHIALKLDECSDAVLVRSFATKRDQAAFAELLRRYHGLVAGVCRRSLSNRCDVEDAVQASFATLARNAARIRKPSSVSSWLHGVAFHTAKRLRDKQGREERLAEPDSLVGRGVEPFEEIATRQQIAEVDRQLSSLPDKYRTPLVLFHFAGQSTQQIAEELGLTTTAVEGRLKRGRQRLKRGLAGEGLLLPTLFSSAVSRNNRASSALFNPAGARGLSCLNQILRTGGTSMFTKSLTTAAVLGLTALGVIGHVHPQSARPERLETQAEPAADLPPVDAPIIADGSRDASDEQSAAEAFHEDIHDSLHEAHRRLFSFFISMHH